MQIEILLIYRVNTNVRGSVYMRLRMNDHMRLMYPSGVKILKDQIKKENNKMLKIKKFASVALAAALCMTAFAGCGSSDTGSASGGDGASDLSGKSIYVVSREEGSGTRDAFTELTGVLEKDADGNKVDNTTISAEITSSTSVMMTTVAGNQSAIGYISLGSLDDTVKALKVNGVEPSTDTVKDGSYTISRPFNIVTKTGGVSAAAQDFINYIMSSDGQAVITGEKYVSVVDGADAYKKTDGVSGKVTVGGSSSVTPVMQVLAESYMKANPDVTVEVEQSDSTTGVTSTIDGVFDIGMASRELKDSETSQGVEGTIIAMDGIAIIVNSNNTLEDITTDQIKSIFTGETTSWGDLL